MRQPSGISVEAAMNWRMVRRVHPPQSSSSEFIEVMIRRGVGQSPPGSYLRVSKFTVATRC
jgi:hypothetical protein